MDDTSMNCIWIGLLKHKLCNHEFDCENCEFDKIFRSLSAQMSDDNINFRAVKTPGEDMLENLISKIENESFDNKVLYLKNQLVIKNLFGNAYYLGVNPIVLYLLDDFDSINDFYNNEIKRDQMIFLLKAKWGMKQFISPINFMIIKKINFSEFKLNKWYAIILFNEFDKENFLLSEEDWLKEKNNLLNILNDYKFNNPQIGQSMLDGGEKIKYLHQFLGEKKYLKLLDSIFV